MLGNARAGRSIEMNETLKWLADLCKEHLLTEKWLLTEGMRVGQQWKDRLSLAGYSTLNLHSKTIAPLVISLVGSELATKKLTFVGAAAARMIVHSLIRESSEADCEHYFSGVQCIDGLADLLVQSIRDLRLAELPPASIDAGSFESTAKAHYVKRIYHAYVSLLSGQQLADYPSCLEIAKAGILNGSIQLPRGLQLLIPEELQLASAEKDLLELIGQRAKICRPSPRETFSDDANRNKINATLAKSHTNFVYFAGHGEVNEVRGVLQSILSSSGANPIRFDDVEILHTDYHQYAPLVLELVSAWLARRVSNHARMVGGELPAVDALPVTFSEGIACVYSRPGRCLRGWLRWARHDFVQAKVVQLLREGLLTRPDSETPIGYARLASTLRRIPIGFQRERYLTKIAQAIAVAQRSLVELKTKRDCESPEPQSDEPQRDFGLPALETIQAMITPLVELAPQPADQPGAVLEKARQFLIKCARADNQLDRYARSKLLDEIDSMASILPLAPDADLDVWQWLEELPLDCRILASGPQPGCLHVAPLVQGGYSGRRHVFILGLDDSRYPRKRKIDPILLDAERMRLSDALPTSQAAVQLQQQTLHHVLFRALDSCRTVHLSYSARNLAQDRPNYPSSSLLEIFRTTSGNDAAHMDDLFQHIGPAHSFVSHNPHEHLNECEQELHRLLLEIDPQARQQILEAGYAHQRRHRIASALQASPALCEFDGWIPEAGTDLDPTANGRRTSPSRLETFGACPRRYFFKYGLGVYPPDEWNVDPEKWLDALQFGNFVHELFEDFLRGHTDSGLLPDVERDLPALRDMLFAKIERLKLDIPIPNQDAFQRQKAMLLEVCEIFLRQEEEYCRTTGARPWILEASIGLHDAPRTELDCPDPVALTLSDGCVIQIGGRIDRVDKLLVDGSERYTIWDYKSGSDYGFSQDDPFQSGRKLQPFLYVGMLRHRIAATGGKAEAVSAFGYFFPTPKAEGRKLQWTSGELKRGDEVLRHICQLIKSGVFVATTDPADCKYCDYLSVCKTPDYVAAESLRKSVAPVNQSVLLPWLRLRNLDSETGVAQ